MNPAAARRLTLAMFLFSCAVGCTGPKVAERVLHFDYVASISEVSEGAKKVDIWIPVPQDDETQKISNLKIKAPGEHKLTTETVYGNRMVYTSLEAPFPEEAEVRVSFDVERREVSSVSSLPAVRAGARLLGGDRMAPISEEVQKRASQAAEGKKAIPAVARGLYDRVLSDMAYDKSGKGWGRGDVAHACTIGKGNCSDFHTLFIAMARSRKIPAFFEIGFPIPADRSEGSIGGYHCWAWYSDGDTWKPVDISEADKAPEKTEYFFGNICQNRFSMSSGRDLLLEPKQQGGPLNFFIYPYVEVDGKPAGAKVEKAFSFRNLD
ncbi:MAG: transglutaminase domain-containing protein [Planctomycetota bacterium]|nr:transglutaminase domain-containing protein [Planctomycetota bacterium]